MSTIYFHGHNLDPVIIQKFPHSEIRIKREKLVTSLTIVTSLLSFLIQLLQRSCFLSEPLIHRHLLFFRILYPISAFTFFPLWFRRQDHCINYGIGCIHFTAPDSSSMLLHLFLFLKLYQPNKGWPRKLVKRLVIKVKLFNDGTKFF